MKARLILSACAALALGVGARAHADEGHKGASTAYEPPTDPQRATTGTQATPSERATGQASASTHTLNGTIDKMKDDKLTLRNDTGATRELSIDSNTKFMQEGKSITRSDLKEGDEVRASLQGDRQVTEISVIQKDKARQDPQHMHTPKDGSKTSTAPTVGGPEKSADPGK